ncbi:MAG: hypothetical protein ABW252_19000 [Polyangiales bacterium]
MHGLRKSVWVRGARISLFAWVMCMALAACAEGESTSASDPDEEDAPGIDAGAGRADAPLLGLRRAGPLERLRDRLEEARERREQRAEAARERLRERLEAERERRERRAEAARERLRERLEAERERRRKRDEARDARNSNRDASVPGLADAGTTTPNPDVQRAALCPPARSADRIPQRTAAAGTVATFSFAELRRAVRPCASCHQTPAQTGGFTYQDAYRGSELLINGQYRAVPGLADVAPRMASVLAEGAMPPPSIRQGDPEGYAKLGARIDAWIAAGVPEQASFSLPNETREGGARLAPAIAEAMTDLGDCIPAPEIVGTDAARDAMFASLAALPERLTDTDLVTLDAYELARRGTVAYDVEYPLWADNAHKGRWVHVPATVDGTGATKPEAIAYAPATKQFAIPENTRFYKTFFKAVRERDGVTRYRKVETRLIVVRHAPRLPLFGTYVWDDAETAAVLLTQPYRSGDPFKDLVLSLEVDVASGARRSYAVPGAHRCNECHQGSESNSFVLGFTPLQVHRRALGAAGRQTPTEADELSQLARLEAYGVVAGIAPESAPVLEQSNPRAQPRNAYELRFQGYATGNCAHCHNPKGYAPRQNTQLRLNLAPGGDVFNFSPSLASIYPGSGTYITSLGNPSQSLLYKRMATLTTLEGASPLLHMPLHTPGIDCDAVDLVGKWIVSIPGSASALAAAESFASDCRPQADISWLEEDFTEPPVYAPRRADWSDPQNGIPAPLRAQVFTEALQELARTPIATGYWLKRSACRFPTVAEPAGGTRPWLVNPDGTPRRPYGEVFYQTPGSAYFANVCVKCHGRNADGDSGLSKTIAALTGGQTRVANLRDGLFGKEGRNLALFDVREPSGETRNLAGNYLIWMASGGTNALFPPQLRELVGAHGANMLNQVRESCARLLPGHPDQLTPDVQIHELYAKVCAFDNPITPELGFAPGTTTPLDAPAQQAWLTRGAQNAGWMLFRFFKEEAATGNWPASPNDCETRLPVTP